MAKAQFDGPVAIMNSASVVDRGAGPEGLLGVTLYPPDPSLGEVLDTRVRYRLDGLVREAIEGGEE